MTAKEFLQRGLDQNGIVKDMIEYLDELRAAATKTTSHISDMPSCGGGGDKICGLVSRMTDISKRIEKEQDILADIVEEISEVINKVEDTQCRKLLHMRYVKFMEFDAIAVKMELSFNHVKNRLHDKSLEKIQDIVISY